MAFQRIHIDGSLANGNEEWSTSFAAATPTGTAVTDPAELAGWAEDAFNAFNSGSGWPGDLRSMIGVSSTIDRVRIYNYPAPNANADALGESTGAAIAGSGTAILPLQSALVYTLQTATPGRRFRGRMYWPFLTATMIATGQISTSVVTLGSRATSFASMLNALCAAAPIINVNPQVVSGAGGFVTPVTSVRVGNVMDTQRRRRDDVAENFGTASV